ncbi:DNA polymerase III subunit gamma/tau [Lapidilactobacillus wuchangensis]|uniref:DNA polymerase III subunit gamma/tau n=1 Tax=Lapidilactobacillus wuchangensis TaxID=2486001 RepID=UPI000F79DA7D|nr:DNA polymerase III subunit gamma/tau [Lapidilactobacillus wuchangensis]
MAYQALYRVWRPQTFAQVVGQKIVTQTLKNSILTDQISHAYLFAGPRGTGKTSCAKIFAKAINCLTPVDGEPCNHCDICRAVNENRLTDVIEIDAASNNGVDEIRDIRDKVKYPPTEAKYKVYIIDEVHMLSTGAFNALLKTLEEPPAHVVFILATTEIQKVPATIISRTQRFNFRRITPADLTEQMVKILDQKQISYDEPALQVISRAADGGMRDALSILDQVLSFGQDHVSLANALEVTGDASDNQLADYLSAVFQKDLDQALQQITQLFANGRATTRLIESMIELFRNLLLQQNSPELVASLNYRPLPDSLKPFAQQLTTSQLYRMISDANETLQQLRNSTHGDLFLEVLTVRLVNLLRESGTTETPAAAAPAADQAVVTQLQSEVTKLQEQVSQLQQTGRSATTAAAKPKQVKHQAAPKINRQAIYQVLAAATKEDLSAVREVWPDLLDKLTPAKRAMMNVSEPVAASPAAIVVAFEYAFTLKTANEDQTLQNDLKQELNHFMNNDANIVLVEKDQWPGLRQDYIQDLHKKKQQQLGETQAATPAEPEQSPVVSQAEQLFGSNVVKIEKD